MKSLDENKTAFGAVTILADGEPCAEVNTEHNGHNRSCWIHVKHSQIITIDYKFKTYGVCVQVDLIVDGILRGTTSMKSKMLKRFSISDSFRTGYYKDYKGPFNPATMLTTGVYSNMTNPCLRNTDTPIGTIEIQFWKSTTGSYSKQEAFLPEKRESQTHVQFSKISLVGPDPDSQINYDSIDKLTSSARSTIRSRLNQPRPGKHYWASFKFRYRQEETLLAAGFLDRPSSRDDKLRIDNALGSPSASRLPGPKDNNGDREVEDNAEKAITHESYGEQFLDVGTASENTIAEPQSQTITACAEQGITDSIPLVQQRKEGSLERFILSETTFLANAEDAQVLGIKEEPKYVIRGVDGSGVSSKDLVGDSFRLRRTSVVSSISSDNTRPVSPTCTRASTSGDRFRRAPTAIEPDFSSNFENHFTMPSQHEKAITPNAESAQGSVVADSPEAAKKRVESSLAEATKVTSHKPADEDQDRPHKRQRTSIKALEAEDEEERRLGEQAEREGEELKRKKEEAEKQVTAKLESLQKSIEDRRRRREERERLNEELRRAVQSLEEGNIPGID